MKTCLLSFILIMTLALIAADHTIAAEKAKYGIKIGINFANLTGDIEEKYWESKARLAPVVGGYAVVKLNNWLFVQPEILLSYKGAKTAEENYSDEIILSYIDIPVFLKLSIPTNSSLRPNLFFGPAANLLTGSEYKVGRYKIEIDDGTTNFDVSAVFGAGVDIASGKGAFVVEGRYSIGFESIDDQREPADIRNRVFTIMVGYTF